MCEVNQKAARPVRPADVERGRMALEEYVRDKGFQLASVSVSQSVGTDGRVNLTYTGDKGGRVTVADVRFEGNETFSDRTLRRQLKNTPERRWWRFWSRETFDRPGFEEDLDNLEWGLSKAGTHPQLLKKLKQRKRIAAGGSAAHAGGAAVDVSGCGRIIIAGGGIGGAAAHAALKG